MTPHTRPLHHLTHNRLRAAATPGQPVNRPVNQAGCIAATNGPQERFTSGVVRCHGGQSKHGG
jgi:hypothetical protein